MNNTLMYICTIAYKNDKKPYYLGNFNNNNIIFKKIGIFKEYSEPKKL
jgi:hypothetical protein